MGDRMSIQETDETIGIVNSVNETVEKEARERQLQETKKKLDLKLADLEQQMFHFAELYGIEDYRTQLMMQLHEVSTVALEQVELINGVTVAVSYLFDTIEFFDEALNFQDEMMSTSLRKKYGLFARFKNWVRGRRVTRNIKNRMAMFSTRIKQIQGISQTIVTSISKATMDAQKKMERNKIKQSKKNPSVTPTESRSLQMVREYLAKKNGGTTAISGSEPTPAGGAPAGNGGLNVDDIL